MEDDMNERQSGEGRQDRWSEGESQYQGNGGSEKSMARSSQGGSEMSQQGGSSTSSGSSGSSGNWSGYVVPYRYYGPGYRGVGYYSVLYQGSGEQQGGRDDWDDQQSGTMQR